MRRILGAALFAIGGVAIALTASCESIIDANFDVTRVRCAHRAFPERPPPGDFGSDLDPITLAIRRFDFGEDGVLGAIGIDQDGLCTNRSQGPSCRSSRWPTWADSTDGEEGVDNGGSRLIEAQQRIFGVRYWSSRSFSNDIESGVAPPFLLLRITGYNGLDRDDRVRVEWFLPGAVVTEAPTTPPWASGAHVIPVDARTGDPATGSTVVDEEAYVGGGVLVARFAARPEAPLLFRFGFNAAEVDGVTLALPVPTIGAAPSLLGAGFTRGTLAGRVSVQELFRQATQLAAPRTRDLLCKDSSLYPRAKEFICSFADADLGGRVDAAQPCNAMSFGLAIELSPVRLGDVVPADPTTRCEPDRDWTTEDCSGPGVKIDAPPRDAGPLPEADGGDAGPPNCVPPGTPNNELGVGAPCMRNDECGADAFCTASFGAPPDARFCSTLCSTPGAPCGAGVHCRADPRGTACVPDVCVR